MWQYLAIIALLCSFSLESDAFWWPKATTETPRSQVLQQIPLTYFRTYTYQPLAGETIGVPFFGFGAAQTPLLSGRHYDPYAVTSYAAARRHDANHKSDVTPPAMGGGNPAPSTTAAPTTTTPTTTSTTTTTTTTPPPTTTTTTTTTSPPTPSSSTTDGATSMRYATYSAEYPTYTRRVNNLYNARPQYPYPDYFNYQPQNTLTDKSGSRIQFVPCMCPVSMPSLSGMSSLSGLAATSTDRDRPVGVSLGSPLSTVPAFTAATSDLSNPERTFVTVQGRHIESEESELEEQDESDQANADADESSDSAEDTHVVVEVKAASELQVTTPTLLESNGLA